MTEPAKVLLAVPTRGQVSAHWALNFARIVAQLPPNSEAVVDSDARPIDIKRERFARRAIREGFSHLWMVDDDVYPPQDALERMLAADKDVVSGLVLNRVPPFTPSLFRIEREEVDGELMWTCDANPIRNWPEDALVEVDAVGCSCLLIKTSALRRVSEPRFVFTLGRTEAHGFEEGMGEDFFASLRFKNSGLRIYCDTGVRCSHEVRLAAFPKKSGSHALIEIDLEERQFPNRPGSPAIIDIDLEEGQ